jgi:hypothetical protein
MRTSVLFAALAAACPTLATAQSDAPRVQAWAAVGAATAGDAALRLRANPVHVGVSIADSSLTMNTPIPTGAQPVLEVGVIWRAWRHAGVQTWFAHDEASPRLASGFFHTSIDYLTGFPAGSAPRFVHDERDTPWPAIDGAVTRRAIGVEGVVPWATSGRLSGTVAAGLCLVRLSGRVAPLPFRSYWLGGHEVLFWQDHELTTRLGSDAAWRASVGASVDSRLTRRLAVTTGARVISGAPLELPVHVRGISPAQTLGQTLPVDAIDRAVDAVVRVPTTSVRILVGLKVGL